MSAPPRKAMHTDVGERLSHATEPYVVERERRSPVDPRRADDLRTDVREGLTGCRVVTLPRISDPRGNLTMVENNAQVPFDIQRVYYLYDVPGGEVRGGHAHQQLEQLVIAASGSFEVLVDDGVHRERFFLNRSYFGLYIPRLVWRELDNFSSGSVCLVIASRPYEEDDYFRSYEEFLTATARKAA
jgi:dTDP-4-dehydrorhamnose 3,5-epimerase-like enzyme